MRQIFLLIALLPTLTIAGGGGGLIPTGQFRGEVYDLQSGNTCVVSFNVRFLPAKTAEENYAVEFSERLYTCDETEFFAPQFKVQYDESTWYFWANLVSKGKRVGIATSKLFAVEQLENTHGFLSLEPKGDGYFLMESFIQGQQFGFQGEVKKSNN